MTVNRFFKGRDSAPVLFISLLQCLFLCPRQTDGGLLARAFPNSINEIFWLQPSAPTLNPNSPFSLSLSTYYQGQVAYSNPKWAINLSEQTSSFIISSRLNENLRLEHQLTSTNRIIRIDNLENDLFCHNTPLSSQYQSSLEWYSQHRTAFQCTTQIKSRLSTEFGFSGLGGAIKLGFPPLGIVGIAGSRFKTNLSAKIFGQGINHYELQEYETKDSTAISFQSTLLSAFKISAAYALESTRNNPIGELSSDGMGHTQTFSMAVTTRPLSGVTYRLFWAQWQNRDSLYLRFNGNTSNTPAYLFSFGQSTSGGLELTKTFWQTDFHLTGLVGQTHFNLNKGRIRISDFVNQADPFLLQLLPIKAGGQGYLDYDEYALDLKIHRELKKGFNFVLNPRFCLLPLRVHFDGYQNASLLGLIPAGTELWTTSTKLKSILGLRMGGNIAWQHSAAFPVFALSMAQFIPLRLQYQKTHNVAPDTSKERSSTVISRFTFPSGFSMALSMILDW